MTKMALPFVVFISLLGWFDTASAGPRDHKPPHRDSAQVHLKVIELRGRLLREMVGLPQERAVEVETILKSFDDEHRTYSTMLEMARKTMRRLVREKSDDDAALARSVEDVRQGHDYLHQVRDKQFRAMQKVLTPKEQAVFFESLGKLRHEVRRRMHRAARKH